MTPYINDPRIGESHTQPIHTSGHTEATKEIKRGAGPLFNKGL